MKLRQHRDDLIVAIIIIAAAAGCVVGSRYATFRLFFAWPEGGTWSNTLAWLEDAAIAVLVTWYFRDHVGKRLSVWWHHHQETHMNDRDAVMRQHITDEVAGMEQRMSKLLHERHESAQPVMKNFTAEQHDDSKM
jgi:hypothetical protein